MALAAFENAAFSYEGKTAVSELNFSVKRGDYLCIVGENGSGKSTLLKGLLRLIPASQGRVVTDSELHPGDIGYLPQQSAAQKHFPAGVYEVVLSGRLARRGMRPFYTKADVKAAEENMRSMDIYDLRGRCFGELSGGQRQRALLARALCAARAMLVLDEPIAGLDPLAAHDLYRRIAQINRDTGMAIVMVSHDLRSAVSYASHILHLKNRPLFYGTTADYQHFTGGNGFLEE